MPTVPLDRDTIASAVKRILIAESRLPVEPERVSGSEPLNGRLLRISSLGLLGVLIKLEDTLDVMLPDDLFAGRSFDVVDDVVDVVLRGAS